MSRLRHLPVFLKWRRRLKGAIALPVFIMIVQGYMGGMTDSMWMWTGILFAPIIAHCWYMTSYYLDAHCSELAGATVSTEYTRSIDFPKDKK
ncbi:hypothetical protein YOLOSWAG_263 [Erwinia phage vB_EamM_Yoloswag]|uniref:Uncharacterized protein n=1 Tax=Erwinia phage vB_EamM_Yoloswag TaxID=1958956 RepID=A0A1S6L3I5_9CAUD|nr:hypothetical protein HOR66_gp263 [Erwinia phage vB_EamM_Yoloswag]AQT28736.1 hypothetical protein YOLOSWAG_263 [Erwinia phage vB_EamM_Yoloswag]